MMLWTVSVAAGAVIYVAMVLALVRGGAIRARREAHAQREGEA